MILVEYKNPTELLLEAFNKGKEEIFGHMEGYLYLYGYMGEETVKNLGVLPDSINNLVEACKGENVFKVLDAVYKVKESEMAEISPEDARNLMLMFTQTVGRSQNGVEVCGYLLNADWEHPTDENKEFLVRLLNPLEYSEGKNTVKQLYYRNRSKVEMLKKIPPGTKVVEFAKLQHYGGFLRSLKTGDMEGFIREYFYITPVSFVSPFAS